MGMVVRSNIMAMNANRQLGINNNSVAKNLEKLSSGFKINRAGDDASGLAISEKMKAQIKGLETASANAQDGISLVQTAEGALTEVHDMLNRMVELATKSANGTIQDDVDREAIQSEVNALNDEIDRISKSTNFNGINLLDGSLGAGKTQIAAATSTLKMGVTLATNNTVVSGVKGFNLADGSTATLDGSVTGKLKVSVEDADGNVKVTEFNIADILKKADGSAATNLVAGEKAVLDLSSIGAGKIELTATKAETGATILGDLDGLVMTAEPATGAPAAGSGLTLQIGDTGDDFNMVTVNVDDMSATGLGTSGLDVSNATAARASIQTIKDAINTVSTNRADMGALQNRLEHTINNLDVAAENMSAANSRIRDTDMAKQMMEYTKMNVLTQAAQAMLAQANQQPQSILQLLR